MIKIEIWASGGGTNAEAIIHYFKNHPTMQITTLGCNRKHAGAFEVAKSNLIPTVYWSKDSWNETNILKELEERNVDYIVLAGFLKLVPHRVTEVYHGRIINIHPSLLPKYGGKDMYGEHVHHAVLANHEKYSGITIHEVNAEFDKGKLLAQYRFALEISDELEEIKSKIQQIEHKNFAPTIEAWINSKSNL